MRTTFKIFLLLALIAGFSMIGTMTSPGPQPAWADVPRNSVGLRRFKRSVRKMFKQMKARSNWTRLYASFTGNGTSILARHGPLRLKARCMLDDLGDDRIEVIMTSTEDGWLPGFSNRLHLAGEEFTVAQVMAPTGSTSYQTQIGAGAIAMLKYEFGPNIALGLGLNAFGKRCFVHGTAPMDVLSK